MDKMSHVQPERFDVRELNAAAVLDAAELIGRAEQVYEDMVRGTVRQYLNEKRSKRMILISGPSGSGKTTTSYRLADALREHGLDPVTVSLDDFFLESAKTPRDRDGNLRYDSVHALDLSAVNRALWSLFYRREAEIPAFDFITGGLGPPRRLNLLPESVVLLEGIHALNPLVTYGLDYESFYKICVYAGSGFCDGGEELLSPRDVRLLRRAIRDYRHRGASLDLTFRMWPGVCEGEEHFIRPFYRYADAILNTVYRYEPLVYRPILLPLLEAVEETSEYRERARDLVRRLGGFGELEAEKVPARSLLQEFIG